VRKKGREEKKQRQEWKRGEAEEMERKNG